jgi:hypothetical protein
MTKYEVKNVSDSKEVREMDRAKIEVVDFGGMKIARFTLKKWWKWSTDVKPIVKTERCEAPHLQYQIAGKIHRKLKDGSEFENKTGNVYSVPSEHDAWVVEDQTAEGIEMTAGGISAELSKGMK